MTPAPLEKLFTKAFKLLSYRPRTLSEIKTKLQRITDSKTDIDTVVEKLKTENLINDQEFIDWWIDQRSRFKPKGNIALRSELLAKGIDPTLIGNSLPSPTEELKLAKKALSKKSNLNEAKAYRFLASRGFTSSTSRQTIDDYLSR